MTQKLMAVVLAFIIGFVGGMLVGKTSNNEISEPAAASDTHMAHAMLFEVPEGIVAPTVDLVIHKDPKAGYNAQIVTTNFRFAPEKASTEPQVGEGHAHIYVDGKKINRVYGEWYHLGDIGEVGEHEIHVELSANDHSSYAQNGEVIEDTEVVEVAPEAGADS